MLRGCLIWLLIGTVVVTSVRLFGVFVIIYGLLALFVLFL
jgi:hypothetical protein